MGSEIKISSEEGKGAKFYFDLQLEVVEIDPNKPSRRNQTGFESYQSDEDAEARDQGLPIKDQLEEEYIITTLESHMPEAQRYESGDIQVRLD